MLTIDRGAGRADRLLPARTIVVAGPLPDAAAAIALHVSLGGRDAWVARIGDHYRWSPTTQGGPTPLIRQVARFLDCRPHEITVGFDTVQGWCIVADPDAPTPVDRAAVFADLEGDAASIEALIEQHLGVAA